MLNPVSTKSLSGTQPLAQDKKIDKSAKDFESILLGSWLQEAEASFAKVPGTDDEEADDDGTAQTQQGMAMQQLGEAMAASGGIGIASLIAKNLHKSDGHSAVTLPDAGLNNSLHMPISRVMT